MIFFFEYFMANVCAIDFFNDAMNIGGSDGLMGWLQMD